MRFSDQACRAIRVPVFVAHAPRTRSYPWPSPNTSCRRSKQQGVVCETFFRGTERHGFSSYADQVEYYHRVEAFLAKNLQGPAEKGSTAPRQIDRSLALAPFKLKLKPHGSGATTWPTTTTLSRSSSAATPPSSHQARIDIKRPWHVDFCRAAARLPRRSRTKARRQAATSMTAWRRAPALQAENQGILVSSGRPSPVAHRLFRQLWLCGGVRCDASGLSVVAIIPGRTLDRHLLSSWVAGVSLKSC